MSKENQGLGSQDYKKIQDAINGAPTLFKTTDIRPRLEEMDLYRIEILIAKKDVIDEEKIKALTSENANKAYDKGLDIKSLVDMDLEKIHALTSRSACTFYGSGDFEFSQLYEMDSQRIMTLTSLYARKYYDNDIKFTDLAKLDTEHLEAITSHELSDILQNTDSVLQINRENLEKLGKMEIARIKSIAGFTKKEVDSLGLTLDILSNMDMDKLKALNTVPVSTLVRLNVPVGRLSEMQPEQIITLTSHDAISCYSTFTMNDLLGLNRDQIQNLIHYSNAKCYKLGMQARDLCDMPTYRKLALTSNNAMECYEKKYITINDISNIEDTNRINALTSNNAMECYALGIQFESLLNLETDRINALTSNNAVKCYKENKGIISGEAKPNFPDFETLSQITSLSELKLATSEAIVKRLYARQFSWDELSEIRRAFPEHIKHHTPSTPRAIEAKSTTQR